MGNWFVKTFRKRSAVRCYIYQHDSRIKEYWVIPKQDGTLDLKKHGLFHTTKEEKYLTSKNVPTFYYVEGNAEPIKLEAEKQSYLSPKKYKDAIDSQIARKLIEASNDFMLSKDTMIIIGVVIFAGFGVAYYLGDKIQQVINLLNQLGVS